MHSTRNKASSGQSTIDVATCFFEYLRKTFIRVGIVGMVGRRENSKSSPPKISPPNGGTIFAHPRLGVPERLPMFPGFLPDSGRAPPFVPLCHGKLPARKYPRLVEHPGDRCVPRRHVRVLGRRYQCQSKRALPRRLHGRSRRIDIESSLDSSNKNQ